MQNFNLYYKHVILVLPLSKIEVTKRIQDNMEYFDLNKFNWSIPRTKKEFLGTLSYEHFYFVRNTPYKNSWRPFITCNIEENLTDSRLVIHFRVNRFVQIFSYVFLTPIVLLTIYSIFSAFWDWHNIFTAIVPISMGGIMLSMSVNGFNNEVNKTLKFIDKILKN